MKTKFSQTLGEGARTLLVGIALAAMVSRSASAQGVDPNQGALTFRSGLDVPSVYVFRGFVQERDPKLTLWPYGDVDLSVFSGSGGVRTVNVNFGVWNSLQSGSSGLEGPSRGLHYWEDFFATLSVEFGGGVKVQGGFSAHTSPNAMFTTIKEITARASTTNWFAPYGFLALELGEDTPFLHQADGGLKKGTYLELGVGPSWGFGGGRATVAVPVKLGLSLGDYYEGAEGDETFGFFDIGGLITVPLSGVENRFGSWNIHGGADVLMFGDTTKAFNAGDRSQVIALVGIGVTY